MRVIHLLLSALLITACAHAPRPSLVVPVRLDRNGTSGKGVVAVDDIVIPGVSPHAIVLSLYDAPTSLLWYSITANGVATAASTAETFAPRLRFVAGANSLGVFYLVDRSLMVSQATRSYPSEAAARADLLHTLVPAALTTMHPGRVEQAQGWGDIDLFVAVGEDFGGRQFHQPWGFELGRIEPRAHGWQIEVRNAEGTTRSFLLSDDLHTITDHPKGAQ